MQACGYVGPRALKRLAALLVTALAFSCLATAGASAQVQANQYGVVSSMNGVWLYNSPQSMWGPQLAAMRANGVQVVRSDANWSLSQPTQMDSWVYALASHRLTWEPLMDNAFNSGQIYYGFDTAAQAFAARYGVGGSFWKQYPWLPYLPVHTYELWNEENNTGASTYLDPKVYGALYNAVHTAIHAADPSASVDVGGLGGVGGTFNASQDGASWYLVYLFTDYPQLAGSIDGYALHPYGSTAMDTAEWVQSFRHTLTHYNVPSSVPIDLTEFGWPYVASNESWRASQMNALGSSFARSNCGVREVAPYDWVNPGTVDQDFGLVNSSGTSTALRPAGTGWFTGFAQGSNQGAWTWC